MEYLLLKLIPNVRFMALIDPGICLENSAGENGSGLGLYLAGRFMEKMDGGMSCYNDNGFVVELFLKKAAVEEKRN